MFTPFAFIQPITIAALEPVVTPVQYLMLGGNFTAYKTKFYRGLVKITPSGSVDTTFDIGVGFTTDPGFGFFASYMTPVLQTDGKLLIGGGFKRYSGSTTPGGTTHGSFIRLNSDATLDATLNTGTGFNGLPPIVAVQPDGKILVAGQFTTYSGSTANRIVRLMPSGARDTTFNTGAGFNNTVNVLQVLPDGDIVVGGAFTDYSGSLVARNFLYQISSSGQNISTLNIGTNGFNSNPTAFVTQSDGKIVIVGNFTTYSGSATGNTRIIRIDPNGTRDATFNTGAGFGVAPTDVVLQSDGKIIVVGNFTTYSGSSINRIVRLNTNGTRDTTFNIGTGLDGIPYGIQRKSDDKVIVFGTFNNYSGSSSTNLVQINTDGTRDTTRLGQPGNTVHSAVLQSDNKLVLVGDFTTYSGSSNRNRIIRANENGTIDETFNAGTGFGTTARTVRVNPTDGSMIVIGAFTTYSGSTVSNIIRLGASGTLDTTFNTGTGFDSYGFSHGQIVYGTDNRIYIGGGFTTYSGSNARGFVILNSTGSIDSIFNYNQFGGFDGDVYEILISGSSFIIGGGPARYKPVNSMIRLTNSGSISNTGSYGLGSVSQIQAMALQSDNKLLVGGDFTSILGSSRNRIVRLNPNGSVDSTFSISTGANNSVYSIVTESNGKIVIGGIFSIYSGSGANSLVRINNSGSVDTTLNIGTGFLVSGFGVSDIIPRAGGKYVLLGNFTRYSGSNAFNIIGINNSGSIDTTFNIGSSTAAVTGSGFNLPSSRGVIDASGNIYVGAGNLGTIGFSTYSSSMVYYRSIMVASDGTVSSSFNSGVGIATNKGFNGAVFAYATQSDGKILAVGQFTNYSGSTTNTTRIIRLNRNGTQDTTFVTGAGFNSNVFDVEVQSDGKILVIGEFTTYSGSSINRIVRLNNSGSRDTTFNVGAGFGAQVNKLVIQPDRLPILVGNFTTYSGSSVNRIVRLTSSGAVDTTFNIGAGLDGLVYDIRLQSDNKVVVAGAFNNYSGSSRRWLARINPNGTNDTTLNMGTGFTNGSRITNVALQSDGKIIAAGRFLQYSGSLSESGIIRLNTSGSKDTTFNPGTGFPGGEFSLAVILGTSFTTPTALEIGSDGGIYCGSAFESYNGTARNGLLKLQSNGSIDTTFDMSPGDGVDRQVCAILPL